MSATALASGVDGFPALPGDPAALRACVRALGDLTAELEDAGYRVEDAVGRATDAWAGRRSLAFRLAGAGVRGQLQRGAATAGALAAAVSALAASLDAAQQRLDDLRRQAVSAQDEVDTIERRRVLVPAGDPTGELAHSRAVAEVQRCRDLAVAVCEEHLRVAGRIGADVDALADRTVDLVGDTDLATLDRLAARTVLAPATLAAAWRVLDGWVDPRCGGVPLPGSLVTTSAAAVAAWWRGLTPLQQAQVLRAHPDRLGNLAGLPAWARDVANRQRLDDVRRDLLDEVHRRLGVLSAVRRLGNGVAVGSVTVLTGLALYHLRDKLRALDALTGVLARPGRRLLSLDARSGQQLHAAVAVGDVDRARHVAVFTPGLGSSVQKNLSSYDREMDDLRRRADAFDQGPTATISWLGYDAPQVSQTFDGPRSVTSARLAQRGSVDLAAFLTGVRASRGDGVHLVALGHSYGSTTTGYAVARTHTGVDDVVLFGSPGYGPRHSTSLHVPDGHLYDIDAPWDPVAATSTFGGSPFLSPRFQQLFPGPVDGHAGASGHVEYLRDGTTSQWDMAAVLAGVPDRAYRSAWTPAG